MRLLVLGGSGRIGKLLRHGWAYGAGTHNDVTFIYQTRQVHRGQQGDILWDVLDTPPPALTDAAPFDCMIVLSGVVPKAGADFTRNTSIGLAALAAAAQLDIPRVLLASTSAVYGSYSNAPFREADALDPVNDYGRSKRAMEEACAVQARASGVALCCLRIGNVAGADALLCNGAALGTGESLQLDVFADGGTPVRSYIGPRSLGQVLVSLARSGSALPRCLNIAAPHPVSMGALARAAQMPVTLRAATEGAHQHITLDCRALAALHRFDPVEAEAEEMVRQWRTDA